MARPTCRRALGALLEACVPVTEFGDRWPDTALVLERVLAFLDHFDRGEAGGPSQ